ncbi:MAG: acyl carrier protein [Clostridia bacterium]|nr:acyl carrier protein [Clostridia bacterium]
MFTKVQKILAKQLRVDEASITMDSKIKEDLGADSLSILELLMTLEEDEGIKIPDEKLATFTVVGDIVRYLDSLQ